MKNEQETKVVSCEGLDLHERFEQLFQSVDERFAAWEDCLDDAATLIRSIKLNSLFRVSSLPRKEVRRIVELVNRVSPTPPIVGEDE